MLTLISTLISFLMGGLPKLLDFFQDRSDKKHELALAQLQIERELEMRKLGFEAQERVEHIHTEQLMIASEAEARHDLIDAQTFRRLMRNKQHRYLALQAIHGIAKAFRRRLVEAAGCVAGHAGPDEREQRFERVFPPPVHEHPAREFRPVRILSLMAADAVARVGGRAAVGLRTRVNAVEHRCRRLRECGCEPARRQGEQDEIFAHGRAHDTAPQSRYPTRE